MTEPYFKSILFRVSEIMQSEYDRLAALIPHLQQRGEGRETILRDFLASFLPGRFGIESGFVIDKEGNTSKQIDIIIYDTYFSPQITLAGKYIFPVECVLGVGEVKSDISSTEILKDAIDKIQSVKTLSRKGRALLGGGFHGGEIDSLTDKNSQICGFIFASSLLNTETMFRTLAEHCLTNNDKRHIWVDIVGSFSNGIYYYWRPGDETKTRDAHPMEAHGLYHKQPDNMFSSLLSFYMILYSQLVDKHVGVAEMVDYLAERNPPPNSFKIFTFPKST